MFALPQPCGDCRNILHNFKTPIDWNRFDVAGDARRRAPRDRKKLKTTEGLSGSSTPNLQDGKTTSKDLDQSGASLLDSDGTQATRSAGRVSLDQLAMFSATWRSRDSADRQQTQMQPGSSKPLVEMVSPGIFGRGMQ
jgi:hypothetical protein